MSPHLEHPPLSYLQPPQNMSPVVVVKDYGGYVDQYATQTEIYRRTNREVRIHECHSACTMALGLPNVCVYPDSIFKFHQAYDPRNHVTNWTVSAELFDTYPVAVRERLGTLTKGFTILRGDELIALGVRDCSQPEPRIMIAQATIKPLPETMTSGASTLSILGASLGGLVPRFGARPAAQPVPDGMLGAKIPPIPPIPLPPEKPDDLAEADAAGGVPLPPPRPKTFLVAYTPSLPPMPMVRMIDGAQAILPAHFLPFPRQPT